MENETPPLPVETTSDPNKEARTMGMLCHLLAFCSLLGVPLGNIIGPLVIWLIKREESPFINACGKESLNFQISMTIYFIIAIMLVLALVGVILLPLIIILNLVLTIIAAIKASDGLLYRYPFTIRFIR